MITSGSRPSDHWAIKARRRRSYGQVGVAFFGTVRLLISISRGIDQNVTLDGHKGGTCGTARSDAVGGIAPPSP